MIENRKVLAKLLRGELIENRKGLTKHQGGEG